MDMVSGMHKAGITLKAPLKRLPGRSPEACARDGNRTADELGKPCNVLRRGNLVEGVLSKRIADLDPSRERFGAATRDECTSRVD